MNLIQFTFIFTILTMLFYPFNSLILSKITKPEYNLNHNSLILKYLYKTDAIYSFIYYFEFLISKFTLNFSLIAFKSLSRLFV